MWLRDSRHGGVNWYGVSISSDIWMLYVVSMAGNVSIWVHLGPFVDMPV